MASRITWDFVRPVFLANRLIKLSVSGSSRTVIGMLIPPSFPVYYDTVLHEPLRSQLILCRRDQAKD